MLCSFQEARQLPATEVGDEAQRLGGIEPRLLAPGFVFTARSEEQFYLSNNLPERLRDLFAPINPRRVDEDALESLCDRAVRLLTESYMLEDFIAQAYTALGHVGLTAAALHVRREAGGGVVTGDGRRGALLALKRVWAQDWTFEATLERLDSSGSVGVDARPAYVFAGPGGLEDAALSKEVSGKTGRPARTLGWQGRVVGLT